MFAADDVENKKTDELEKDASGAQEGRLKSKRLTTALREDLLIQDELKSYPSYARREPTGCMLRESEGGRTRVGSKKEGDELIQTRPPPPKPPCRPRSLHFLRSKNEDNEVRRQ